MIFDLAKPVMITVCGLILSSCISTGKNKSRNPASISSKCKILLKNTEVARDNLLPIVDELHTAKTKHSQTQDRANLIQIIEDLYKNKNGYSQAKNKLAEARNKYQQARRDPYPQNNLRSARIHYYQAIDDWNQSIDKLYGEINNLAKAKKAGHSQGTSTSASITGKLRQIIDKLINSRNEISEARNRAFHAGCYFV